MKAIITIAIFALSLSGFAQQRQIVRQQEPRQMVRVDDYRHGNFTFSRLGLTLRQERMLVSILKDKQNEERNILRRYRNPASRLIQLDRKYDRKIYSVLNRAQYDKWHRIYAYQYESYGNRRLS